jgi:hypothetical protein
MYSLCSLIVAVGRTKSSSSNQFFQPRQHGYGYVYQYPAYTDASIHHFLKQSDTWICLNIFSKNNIVHTRYKIK